LAVNNEVAGFKFATVGVLYAVPLAFVVIIVWERLNEAENDVAQEAGAAVTIFRLADGLGSGPATALRDSLTSYVRTVVADDWPAMERGGGSPATRHALNGLYATLLTFHPDDRRGAALVQRDSPPVGSGDPGAPGAAGNGLGHRPRHCVTRAVRRSRPHGASPSSSAPRTSSSGGHGRGAVGTDLPRTAHHRRHRPSVLPAR
jgi:hypothetical protein